ncbi:TOBE domain-containing protein [Leucobacter soli]|uniref:TOBE domain-containing protein n=1 Tax=Leucobacter soli TaxID=2812850 RepID=UPI003616C94B
MPAGPAASAGRALQLVLRAERLVLTAPGTESRHGFGVPAVVTEFEFLGSVCHWRLLLSDGTKLGATAPSAAIVEGDRFLPGDRVNVSWDPATTAVLATSPTIEGAS